MKRIFISEIEILFSQLNNILKKHNKKMPGFKTRYPNILESSLVVPFEEFGGQPFYKGLLKKSAITFYLMIKDHAFRDGNKRIALATLLFFLAKNNKWLNTTEDNLYNFILWVTESSAENKTHVISEIESFIINHLVKYTV